MQDKAKQFPDRLWTTNHGSIYGLHGSRDFLIIAPDLPLHNPEAVARRPGQLTEEDRQTLLSQGVSPQGQDELAIVKARYNLRKDLRIVGVKSGKLSREEVMESIGQLLTTTKNDGGMSLTQKDLESACMCNNIHKVLPFHNITLN